MSQMTPASDAAHTVMLTRALWGMGLDYVKVVGWPCTVHVVARKETGAGAITSICAEESKS